MERMVAAGRRPIHSGQMPCSPWAIESVMLASEPFPVNQMPSVKSGAPMAGSPRPSPPWQSNQKPFLCNTAQPRASA